MCTQYGALARVVCLQNRLIVRKHEILLLGHGATERKPGDLRERKEVAAELFI